MTTPEIDMLEKCARAICIAEEVDPDGPHPDDETGDGFPLWMFAVSAVKAVLTTLLEPDSAMIVAGQEADRMSGDPHGQLADSRTIFTAMIRQALGEK